MWNCLHQPVASTRPLDQKLVLQQVLRGQYRPNQQNSQQALSYPIQQALSYPLQQAR